MKIAMGFRHKLAGNLDVIDGKYSLYPVRQQFDQLKARITSGWNVEHTPAGSHAFPTGSWTPTIGGTTGATGQVYAYQNGTYVLLGDLVLAEFYVELSTEGTITGSAQLQGLPFPATTYSPTGLPQAIGWHQTATNFVNAWAAVVGGSTTARLWGIAAAGTTYQTAITATEIGASTAFAGVLTYRKA